MPRFVYLLGIGIVLVALAFALTDKTIGPRSGSLEAKSRRIENGMTISQVETILGGPGTYLWGFTLSNPEGSKSWSDEMGMVTVDFTWTGKVQRVAFKPKHLSVLYRLRLWLMHVSKE